jgi:hypothetical protein
MTAREAARRYSASWQRATVGFATTLPHHYRGHDPPRNHAQRSEKQIGLLTVDRKPCEKGEHRLALRNMCRQHLIQRGQPARLIRAKPAVALRDGDFGGLCHRSLNTRVHLARHNCGILANAAAG